MLTFIRLFFSSGVALLAENLFLRKQLALFQERKARRDRTTASFRLAMVALAKFFNWCDALVIVKPETFVGWHRTAFKMLCDGSRADPAVRRYRKTSENWLPDGSRKRNVG